MPTRPRSVLVIGLPGRPNPPEQDRDAGRLFHGTWRSADPKGPPVLVDPVQALTEAALRCGQRRFDWRGLSYDHGNEMVLPNDGEVRRALSCVAGKVPFDFYVRVEHGTGR